MPTRQKHAKTTTKSKSSSAASSSPAAKSQPAQGQTRNHDPRHGRRGHHVRRRRGSGTQRHCQADRLADPDGHHPPGQAHRRRCRRRSRILFRWPRSTTWSSPAGIFSKTTCTPPPRRPACWSAICWSRSSRFSVRSSPRKAVFDQNYVKKLDGPNVKKGKNKMDLAEQVRADIRDFKKTSGASRLVMIWCGSTEIFIEPTAAHQSVEAFEKALDAERRQTSRLR